MSGAQTEGMSDANLTVWLTLQAHEPVTLIDYLVEVLGFVLTAKYGSDDTVEHAELLWPEGAGGVMLGEYRPGREWSRQPGTAGGYVVTSDIDGAYAQATQAGAEFIMDLHDTDYGSREFVVRDPEGNLWSVGTYAGAARPA